MFDKNCQLKLENKRKKRIKKLFKYANKKLWKSLSESKKDKVINKYYKILDSSNVDIKTLLEDVRQTRIIFGTLALGMLLGVLASASASILLKYTSDKGVNDIIILFLCAVVFLALIKVVGDITKDDFRDYKILDRLLESVDREDIIKLNSTKKIKN